MLQFENPDFSNVYLRKYGKDRGATAFVEAGAMALELSWTIGIFSSKRATDESASLFIDALSGKNMPKETVEHLKRIIRNPKAAQAYVASQDMPEELKNESGRRYVDGCKMIAWWLVHNNFDVVETVKRLCEYPVSA